MASASASVSVSASVSAAAPSSSSSSSETSAVAASRQHPTKLEEKVSSYGGGGEALFMAGAGYAAYRPSYPPRLYNDIEAYAVTSRTGSLRGSLAVDIACGTGQATVDLARHYANVIGVEASAEQLAGAVRAEGVVYLPGRSERVPLGDSIADLVTVAQAAHWFDLPAFFAETHRILKPGGSAAIWCYGLCYLDNEAAQAHLLRLYEGTLGGYWDERRTLIDQLYHSIQFPSPPFTDLKRSTKRIDLWEGKTLTIRNFILYLGTWSAYNTYRKRHPERVDPLIALEADLVAAYGGTRSEVQVVRTAFDVTLLLARKASASSSSSSSPAAAPTATTAASTTASPATAAATATPTPSA